MHTRTPEQLLSGIIARAPCAARFTRGPITLGEEVVTGRNTTNEEAAVPLHFTVTAHGLETRETLREVEHQLHRSGAWLGPTAESQCLKDTPVHTVMDPAVQLVHVTPKAEWQVGDDFVWQVRATAREYSQSSHHPENSKPFPQCTQVHAQLERVHRKTQMLCDHGLDAAKRSIG